MEYKSPVDGNDESDDGMPTALSSGSYKAENNRGRGARCLVQYKFSRE
jgi:hypothetical protein